MAKVPKIVRAAWRNSRREARARKFVAPRRLNPRTLDRIVELCERFGARISFRALSGADVPAKCRHVCSIQGKAGAAVTTGATRFEAFVFAQRARQVALRGQIDLERQREMQIAIARSYRERNERWKRMRAEMAAQAKPF